jgi:hypothetical protein
MRGAYLTLALLCGALAPAQAEAKAIEDMRLAADANDIVITVLTEGTLNTPTVRTGPGVVRVRLSDVVGSMPKKLEGDGSALRSLELIPWGDGTAAIAIMLGDQTRLLPTDLRVQTNSDHMTLRIARGLLPPLSDDPNVRVVAKKPPKPPDAKPAEPALTAQQ